MKKLLLYTSLFAIVFQSCKTVQPSSSKKDDKSELSQVDSALVSKDTIKLVEVAEPKAQDSIVLTVSPLKDTITLIGVGDIMIGTNFPNEGYLPPDSGKYMLAEVAATLRDADLTFGNQEGVILNEGGKQKYCSNPDVCYIFRSPEYLAQHYVEAGIDFMSLANNHAGDFGDEGRKNTMRTLDSLGIHHAGQLAQPFTIFEKDRVTYGFAAFSPNTGTQSINDLEAAVDIVKHLDSLSDIIIISFHGGAEGSKYEHLTREREFFYGENRGNVYEFSHALIDAGADVIFGHGPHVARAVEVYKNRFIAYSLGNFATYGRFNLRGVKGLAPIAKINIDNKGKFISGKIISAKQKGAGIPVIDGSHAAALRIKELTESDFPESNISIDLEGNIRYLHNHN
ncbi:hypothetical protein GCM10027429_12290 [Marivirga atlantica]|jgi:hypothetical protein|uniref:CapA family protein n=1 Tax=Marivirga atlantica TaxID=1548457 RepID=A0A937A6Y8_9BACT|nr:CapA family protein [Marivirga atlantica]MBL0764842.1 CapA family protein [Marivirga atlantica]